MAVRDFPDGAGITLAPGNAAALPTGAWTIAVITKPMALNTFRVVVAVGSAIADLGLWTTSSGGIQAVLNGFGRPIDLPLVENEWFLIAITKTAGVAIPRGHAYRYSTGTWTHLSATDTLEDKVSVSVIELGRTNNDWFYVGYMAVAGVWNTALSDTQIETLESSLQAWLDTGAVAVWPLNQESTATSVVDITGGGADQTAESGTAVVTGDDPPFDFSLGGGGDLKASDTATFTDAATTSADLLRNDALTAADAATTGAELSGNDSGTLTESVQLTFTTNIAVEDVATLAEAVLGNVSVSAVDAATLADTANVQQLGGDANLSRTDTATLTDEATVQVTLTSADTISAADLYDFVALLNRIDSSTTLTAVSSSATVTASEAAALAEVLGLFDPTQVVIPPMPLMVDIGTTLLSADVGQMLHVDIGDEILTVDVGE